MQEAEIISDGLQNAVTGTGGAVDPRTAAAFRHAVPLSDEEVLATYRESWLGRKIIDIPVADMTRERIDIQADSDVIEKYEAVERRLQLWAKLRQALTYGRLGGGAMILGGLNGDISREARSGTIKYLHVVSKRDISTGPLVTDITSEFFGHPTWYSMSGVKIHASRVVPFRGLPTFDKTSGGLSGIGDNVFWGDPLYKSIKDAVINASLAQNEIASLIAQAKIDAYMIENLADVLQTKNGEEKVKKRIETINTGKSLHRAVIMDAKDKWEHRQINLSGMKDIIQTYLGIVAGAADIPATRLLGKSPDGMNATGESDEKNYHNSIRSLQEQYLSPALDRILPFIADEIGSGLLEYSYPPLSVPSEAEMADIAKKKAETTQIYADLSLLPQSEFGMAVANQLSEDRTYPGMGGVMALMESMAGELDAARADS